MMSPSATACATPASGKWRNLAKHPIGDFVAPEAMFDWLEANALATSRR